MQPSSRPNTTFTQLASRQSSQRSAHVSAVLFRDRPSSSCAALLTASSSKVCWASVFSLLRRSSCFGLLPTRGWAEKLCCRECGWNSRLHHLPRAFRSLQCWGFTSGIAGRTLFPSAARWLLPAKNPAVRNPRGGRIDQYMCCLVSMAGAVYVLVLTDCVLLPRRRL